MISNKTVRFVGKTTLFSAALSFSIAANAVSRETSVDATIAACRTLRHTDARAALEQCSRAYQDNQSSAVIAFEMLSHRSDAEVALGQMQDAKKTLSLMALVLPPEPWEYRYRLLKRRGLLAYRMNELSKAQGYLNGALTLAQTHQNHAFLGFIYTDLATLARRTGDYRTSLSNLRKALAQLHLVTHADLAPTLNNLADLHKDLGEFQDAQNRYGEAIKLFQAQGKTQKVAHVKESLGLLNEVMGDLASARTLLEESYKQFAQLGAQADAVRVLGDLLRLALDQADLAAAALILQRWQPGANVPTPYRLAIQQARFWRLSGNAVRASAALELLRTTMASDDRYLPALYVELAECAGELGKVKHAASLWRDAMRHERALLTRNYQQETAALRVGLEVQQNERLQAEAVAAQAKSEAQVLRSRNQLRWLAWIATFSVALLGALAFWQRARQLQRRFSDAKKLASAQRQYRVAANALRAQDERQHAMLELIADASAIVDVNGQFERVNHAFAQAFACAPSELLLQPISTWLPDLPLAAWQQLTGQLDEAETGMRAPHRQLLPSGKELLVQGLGAGQLGFLLSISQATSGGTSGGHDSTHLRAYPLARIATIAKPDLELTRKPNFESTQPIVEAITELTLAAKPHSTEPRVANEKPRTDELDGGSWDRVEQRQRLVALMVASLQAFERSTGKTRIELAERSKLWRVTIDDGRLRVRAMERYLSLQKLPKVPRWRDVLRTTYFVLAECTLENTVRAQLEAQLEQVQTHLKLCALLPDVDALAQFNAN